MGNYKSFIVVIFSLLLFPAFAFAVTPEELRSQYISEVYKNKLPGDVPSISDKVNAISKVYGENGYINQTTTTSGSVNGSAVSSVSTVSKAASAAAAAGQMAKRYGAGLARGLPQSIVGGLIVQGIVQGVGWLIDNGGKIHKRDPSSVGSCASGSVCYHIINSDSVNFYSSDPVSLCTNYINQTNPDTRFKSVLYSAGQPASCRFYFISNPKSVYSAGNIDVLSVSDSASHTSSPQPVTQEELAAVLQKYLEDHPNTTITNNFYQLAYSEDPANDAPGSLADQISAGIQKGLQDAVKTGSATTNYTDANGQTATINTTINNDGTTVNNNYNTTTNTDGSTSTTGKTDIPAFCSWASIMCDWYTWTKTTYDSVVSAVTDFFTLDNSDTTVQVDDSNSNQDQDFSSDISFGSQCPAPITLINSSFMGVPINWQYDFSDFCTILSDYVRPILIAMGAFIAALIIGGVRTTDD